MQQPDETRPPPGSWSDAFRIIGATFGVVLAIVLLLLMVWNRLLDTVLRQSGSPPPEWTPAPEMLAIITCLTAAVLLGMGRQMDGRMPPVLFIVAGVLTLFSGDAVTPGGATSWSSLVRSFQGPYLFLAASCFVLAVLAALSYWLRSRPE